jgi:hypothetical protein
MGEMVTCVSFGTRRTPLVVKPAVSRAAPAVWRMPSNTQRMTSRSLRARNVHLGKGHPGKALGSFGLRVGVVAAGTLPLVCFVTNSCSRGESCETPILLAALLGAAFTAPVACP